MGRPGGGHRSVGRSGGGHSFSRSSGGHRIGSSRSSRPRPSSGGGFGGTSYGSSGGGYRHTPRYSRHTRYVRTSRMPGRSNSGCGCLSSFMAYIIVFIILMICLLVVTSGGNGKSNSGYNSDIPMSSYNREKLDAGNGFYNDCIVDELDWFDNESRTEGRLKNFFDKTGVQPYIMLLDYNPELKSDSDKEAYALKLYEEYIDNEATFLYVYFAEQDEDDVGYMCYVNGIQVGSVMDSEAVDIFWAFLDNYWYSDMSTDDVFISTFDSTAERIMTKTTTKEDVQVAKANSRKTVIKYVLIVAAAGIVVFGVIKVVKLKHQRAKEEAEETERILNTPMESLVDAELKETAKKYDDHTGQQ